MKINRSNYLRACCEPAKETGQTYYNIARACLIDYCSDLIMLSLNEPKLNEIQKLHNRIRNKRVIIVNSE